MAHAKSGTRTTPPIANPSIAKAIAVERFLINQLLRTVIIGNQVPSPIPDVITMNEQ